MSDPTKQPYGSGPCFDVLWDALQGLPPEPASRRIVRKVGRLMDHARHDVIGLKDVRDLACRARALVLLRDFRKASVNDLGLSAYIVSPTTTCVHAIFAEELRLVASAARAEGRARQLERLETSRQMRAANAS